MSRTDAIPLKGKRVFLACLLVLGALIAAVIVLPSALACGVAEGRAFVAIVHPDGQQLEPEGHADAESCFAMFETSQSVDSVVGHYREELSDAGWTDPEVVDHSGTDVRGDHISSFDVTARSGAMYFVAYVRSYPDSEVTHVTVHVYDA